MDILQLIYPFTSWRVFEFFIFDDYEQSHYNICIQVFEHKFSFILGHYLGIAELYDKQMLNIIHNSKLFSETVVPFCIPTKVGEF